MRNKNRILNKGIAMLMAMILTISGILGFAAPVIADSGSGTITVCVERFSIGQGYLIEPYLMDIQAGDTYETVCRRVLEENGFSYTTKGASFYLSGIHNADEGILSIPSCVALIGPIRIGIREQDPPDNSAVNEYAGSTAWLGEFSYSRMSGWMYSVGNDNGYEYPGVGMDGRIPRDGDVFRLQFSVWGYGADLTGQEYGSEDVIFEVGDKTALTRKIAEINEDKENWFLLEGCETAYQNAVACLKKLDATQAELDNALAALPLQAPVFPESVSLTENNVILAAGESHQLTAQIYPETADQRELMWESSDSRVVSVDSSGFLSAISNGEADITVSSRNGKSAVCHVTVKERSIESITLNITNALLEVGDQIQLSVSSYLPENATEELSLTYRSSDSSVASVNSSGLVSAVRSGSAAITVTARGGAFAVCQVVVGDKVELAMAIQGKIEALPLPGNVTEETAAQVMAVWEEYDRLSDLVKAEVSETAIRKLAQLKPEAERILERQENVAEVNRLLQSLPSLSRLTLEDESLLQQARSAYEALTVEERGQVDAELYARLLNLERQLSVLKAEVISLQERLAEFSTPVTVSTLKEAVELWNLYTGLNREQQELLTPEDSFKLDQLADSLLSVMTNAVNAVDTSKKLELSSQTLRDFLVVTEAYEELDGELAERLPAETISSLQKVKNWIGESIQTAGALSLSADWFVQLLSEEQSVESSLETAIKNHYSASAKIVFCQNISFLDIRSQASCQPETALRFEVDLKQLAEMNNPKVLTVDIDGSGKVSLKELTVEQEDSILCFQTSHSGRLLIVDYPIAVTGISLPATASVGIGSSLSLSAEYTPVNATLNRELKWESADSSIVQVGSDGTIKGIAPGTVDIKASVKGNPSIYAVCRVRVTDEANPLTKSVEQVMKETSAYMLSLDTNPAKGSEWFVLGLARSGKDLNDKYFSTYYNHIANYLKETDGKLTTTALYTEYSKMILVMTAIGKDPRDVAGYNLLSYLADMDKVTKQGINGPIWALIAVNAKEEYEFPVISGISNPTTEKKLIACILEAECSGGGWAMTGDKADPDITGMALQGLAPYYHKSGYEDVTAAIDRAVNRLSEIQNSTGGFSTMNVETSESCAQILTGLCAIGIDPKTDARFIKNGHWIVENLISYQISGSGFMHVKAGAENNGGAEAGTVNGMATEQGFYALTAYQRFVEGKTSLYDMSDMTVKEGGDGDGSGTGLEDTQDGTGTSAADTDKNTSSSESTPTKTASGVSKSVSSTSKSVISSLAGSETAAEETAGAEETKAAEGWSFEGEEYQPDTETTAENMTGDGEAENLPAEEEGVSSEVVPYLLCVVCGVSLLVVCITLLRKKR